MPAKSIAQRRAIAIASHHPEKLYSRNRSLLKMKRKDMHDFASTREKGLPRHKRKKRGRFAQKRRTMRSGGR